MIDGAPRRPLPRPTAARLLEGVLALGRDLHLGMDERALAERFLGALRELFPGRRFAIRLVAAGGELTAVAAPAELARLPPAALAAPLALKRSSLAKTGLDPAHVAAGRVRLIDAAEPPLLGSASGFTIPLVAGGDVYGALDVAYPEGAGVDDEPVLIPIANHLSVALRNVRLHAETRVLRDTVAKLIDHADALIFAIDGEHRVTVWNRTLGQLTGRDAAGTLGRDVRDLLPTKDRARVCAVLDDALAGRAVAPIDVVFRDVNGAEVRAVWNVAAISDAGAVEGVVVVGHDLTRMSSLERQVIQAEKLATLGQLAAGVVHELNNPLTSITVYADYLARKLERAGPRARGPFDAADGEKLRRILEGAERILAFARALVQYARPSGEQPDTVALNDVVRQALFLCEHVVAGVQLDVELAERLPPVSGVRGQLIQVVINLVTNAVQALPSPALGRIAVRTLAPAAAEVAIVVEDTGSGIRAEDRERIFEPFFTTKADGKGSGLGLSIVRGIVERHRGTIAVDSLPGRGSIFTVTLPVETS
jgi:PAS domain S-box-containing protein